MLFSGKCILTLRCCFVEPHDVELIGRSLVGNFRVILLTATALSFIENKAINLTADGFLIRHAEWQKFVNMAAVWPTSHKNF